MAAPADEVQLLSSSSTASNAAGSAIFIPADITPAIERHLKVGSPLFKRGTLGGGAYSTLISKHLQTSLLDLKCSWQY